MEKLHTKKYIFYRCSNCNYIRLIKNKHTFKYNLKVYLFFIYHKGTANAIGIVTLRKLLWLLPPPRFTFRYPYVRSRQYLPDSDRYHFSILHKW